MARSSRRQTTSSAWPDYNSTNRLALNRLRFDRIMQVGTTFYLQITGRAAFLSRGLARASSLSSNGLGVLGRTWHEACPESIMSKATLSPLFPATQKDVSRLRQSATDAVNDFSSTALTHANKVGGQLHDLADHLQKEGRNNFDRARGKVTDIVRTGGDFARENPVTCIGIALAVGFLIGLSRRRSAPRND